MSDKNLERVRCPYCGYEMPVFVDRNAVCKGVFVRCKGRKCRKIFEIRKEAK